MSDQLTAWARRFASVLVLSSELLASGALLLMLLIPLLEIALRPLLGSGIENAPLLVQHLGLVLAMCGALLAERGGHLSSLGNSLSFRQQPALAAATRIFALVSAALLSALLAAASGTFVASELAAGRELAYGLPVWWLQAFMPAGFALLTLRFGARIVPGSWLGGMVGLFLLLAGLAVGGQLENIALPLWPFLLWLVLALLCGAPVFAILGGLALFLFWSEGQPLAAVPLSHYQITVNPSLPALPLFTLAGLIFARSGAAQRLSQLFTALFGGGAFGTAIAAAVLCSFFTALTGGSGVTILALGGLLLPLLRHAGFSEKNGISLVTSASALGVLLAPSVPLIMYAIVARVPINTMFLAGIVPALVMVFFLLVFGGYLRGQSQSMDASVRADWGLARRAAWAAKWELLAPVIAIGSLAGGLATPTESAALTAAYALLTQALIHRETTLAKLRASMADGVQIIGSVMLILGMALGLTNFLIDAGIPDAAVAWAQGMLPNQWAFLVALIVFLFIAGALVEIYAAIVVLVPLLLPVALSYGIDPVHFGVIFLAVLEMGFLCPPAGMNIFFASAMFQRPVREIAVSVLPALLAMFLGALCIALLPGLSTWLPGLFAATGS